jgi:site-specific DNA-cytosine methylase
LGLPYIVESASEPDTSCRSFMAANYNITHMHYNLESQNAGHKCLSHPEKASCSPPQNCDFFIAGTPCPPFSRQRAKRFSHGSVKNHLAYGTTFTEFLDFLLIHEPRAGVFEQVLGFNLPEGPTDDGTPLLRPRF